MAAFDEARRLDLQPLHRTIDIAHGAAGRAFFAEHMPGLQRLPQFERDAAMMDAAERRKTKLELRRIPFRREFVAGLPELIEHAEKILPEEMRQHEAIVQRRAPAHELALLRFAPELCDQRADQQLLRQRHPGIGRHFERAEFDQPEAAGRPVGRIELVDADFGAMGIAGDVDEDMPEQAVDQP